jgi:HKD family nuclease
LSDDEADDMPDGETYRIAKEFAQKVMELAEETAAEHDFLSVKQLLQHAKMINSAKVARIKIKKHTGWNVALEEMKNSTDKADREPTRQKAFTGDYQNMVKDTYHANKDHYQAIAEQKNADVKAGESQALKKTQEKALRQLKRFVSAFYLCSSYGLLGLVENSYTLHGMSSVLLLLCARQ